MTSKRFAEPSVNQLKARFAEIQSRWKIIKAETSSEASATRTRQTVTIPPPSSDSGDGRFGDPKGGVRGGGCLTAAPAGPPTKGCQPRSLSRPGRGSKYNTKRGERKGANVTVANKTGRCGTTMAPSGVQSHARSRFTRRWGSENDTVVNAAAAAVAASDDTDNATTPPARDGPTTPPRVRRKSAPVPNNPFSKLLSDQVKELR
jgi:hypothetical protein